MFFTIGDSSLLASGQESWMHGSQSFWLVERTFSIFELLLFSAVDFEISSHQYKINIVKKFLR